MIPTEPRKKLSDELKEKFDVDPNRYTTPLNIFHVYSKVTLFLLQYPVLLPIIFGFFGYVNLNLSPTENIEELGDVLGGTGGADYTVLGDDFVIADDHFSCDSGVWELEEGEQSTTMFYSSSTALGLTTQFGFVPTGQYAANVAYGRPDLYEIVFGDNGFDHISVKHIGAGLFDVHQLNSATDGVGNREYLQEGLSTTTMNTVRISEQFASETTLYLLIDVNNVSYITAPLTVLKREKYTSSYLGLLAGGEAADNHTGMSAPELRICE